MMKVIGIAILLMMTATIGVHMGLPQTIAQIVGRICRCHKCLSFWMTLAALVYIKCDIVMAVLLSFAVAYLSNWFAIILIVLNRLYNRLWEKVNRK